MAFQVLTDIEHIRKNYNMWLGRGVTHLFDEIFDNALDELMNKYANRIEVTLDTEKPYIRIKDNGRGILIDNYTHEGITRPIPEWIFSKVMSGEKFSITTYKRKIGLHGVGACVVNAMSKWLNVIIHRNGKEFILKYNDAQVIDKSKRTIQTKAKSETGTDVEFEPNLDRFLNDDEKVFDTKYIMDRLHLVKDMVPSATLIFNGEEITSDTLHERFTETDTFKYIGDIVTEDIICRIGYDLTSDKPNYRGAVNILPIQQGSHISAMEMNITKAWEPFISGKNIQLSDVTLGLVCDIYIFIEDPKFASQAKISLKTPVKIVNELFDKNKFSKKLGQLINKSKYRDGLLKRFEDYRVTVNQLHEAKTAQKYFKIGTVIAPGHVSRSQTFKKLADCSSTNREITELFVCEGDSASGSLKIARDPVRHAILPLRGKILNAVGESMEKIIQNQELREYIESIGIGVAPKINMKTLRYEKVITCADADQDGQQITALLLGVTGMLLPNLIEEGHFYVCAAPLYKQGDKYFYTTDGLDLSKPFKRFKGLGELNPDQMYDLAFDEKKRVLYQVTPDNMADAIRLVGDPEFRKNMLIERGIL